MAKDPWAYEWAEDWPNQLIINEWAEEQIVTPHEWESEDRPPVWLIFVDNGDGAGWFLNCVCDSEESARNHYIIALPYPTHNSGVDKVRAYIERVPCNHAFGSSLHQLFWEEELKRRRDFVRGEGQYAPRVPRVEGHGYYRGKKGD